jgi:hypothetical protein
MVGSSLRMIRVALTCVALLAIPSYAAYSLVARGAGPAAELARADDPIRSGFYVLAPQEPAAVAPRVKLSGNIDEEVVATVWTFTDRGHASPWQGGGSPTTTTLTGPTHSQQGNNVTFHCTVTGSNTNHPPQLTCTFFDGTKSLGTVSLTVPTAGTTSTCSLTFMPNKLGSHNISAKYNGDFNDMPSTSNTVVLVVTE